MAQNVLKPDEQRKFQPRDLASSARPSNPPHACFLQSRAMTCPASLMSKYFAPQRWML